MLIAKFEKSALFCKFFSYLVKCEAYVVLGTGVRGLERQDTEYRTQEVGGHQVIRGSGGGWIRHAHHKYQASRVSGWGREYPISNFECRRANPCESASIRV